MLEDIPYDQLLCTLCSRPLGENVDDQPYWPSGPMCGDCYQAREMDNDLWAMELNEEVDSTDEDV